MKLYIKILKFIIPYWKSIVVSILLTFIYVLFNNLSLWVTVNFVEEIFSPEYVEGKVSTGKPVDENISDPSIYQTINLFIKDLLIQVDRYDTLIAVCIVIFLSYLILEILSIFSFVPR